MSVLSCPVQEEVGIYTRKLEVVHKGVGGCLISYNLRLACVRVDSSPLPPAVWLAFRVFLVCKKEVFFGAKTLFWALFSLFLMDQNPFSMTATRICGNTINHCFKKGQKKKGLISPRILSCSSFPPGGLWAFTDTQLMIKITRRLPKCPPVRPIIMKGGPAAAHGWRSRPICEFLQIPRASSGALCKIGPPASETGGRDWY